MSDRAQDSPVSLLVGGLAVVAGVGMLLLLAVGGGGWILIGTGCALLVLDHLVTPTERVLRWIVRGAGVVAIVLGAAVLLIG